MKTINLLLLLPLLASCKFADKEAYILPQGFIGNAVMLTNVKNGTQKSYDKNDRRLYVFPKTGILLSQFKETYGIIDRRFFYSTIFGSEIKGIHYRDDFDNLEQNKIYAFYGNDVTITFPNTKDTVGLQIITVCKPKDYDTFKNEKFVKLLLGIHFAYSDLEYKKLLALKNASISSLNVPTNTKKDK
jgi:hypothetical protein